MLSPCRKYSPRSTISPFSPTARSQRYPDQKQHPRADERPDQESRAAPSGTRPAAPRRAAPASGGSCACRVNTYPAAVSRLPTNSRPGNAANSAARNRRAGASTAPGPSERPIRAVRASMSARRPSRCCSMARTGSSHWPVASASTATPPTTRTTATPTTTTSDRTPRRRPSSRTSAGAPNSSRKMHPLLERQGHDQDQGRQGQRQDQHRPAMAQPYHHEGERAEQAQHDPQDREETARGEQADRQDTGQDGFRRGGQPSPALHLHLHRVRSFRAPYEASAANASRAMLRARLIAAVSCRW